VELVLIEKRKREEQRIQKQGMNKLLLKLVEQHLVINQIIKWLQAITKWLQAITKYQKGNK
jgi:predicted transcriptional regulator